MNPLLNAVKRFILNLSFWVLSLLCEIPFYLCAAIMDGMISQHSVFPVDGSGLEIGLIVGYSSLFCRLISFHLIGSWVLKWVLINRRAGPMIFGISDFLLANLWIGVWALWDPDGPTSILFHRPHDGSFPLSEIWFIAIPAIGLGSATFRSAFAKDLIKTGKPPKQWNALVSTAS